jgi:hypothetical protein
MWLAVEYFFDEKPTAKTLWDFREARGAKLKPKDIEDFTSYAKNQERKRPPGKTAFLSHTNLGFGLSRMGEIFSEVLEVPWEFRSFRSIEEAVKWLEISFPEEWMLHLKLSQA